MDAHSCESLVLSCIDYRIQERVYAWLHKKFPHDMYDYVAFAGGIKHVLAAEAQIALSVRLHHIKKVILIEHEDCGAYGKEGTKEMQLHDLIKGKAAIQKRYPTLSVQTYYLSISGEFEEVK